MQEEWKDIIVEENGVMYDYTNLYKISNTGKIKSYCKNKNGTLLKIQTQKNGYQIINLYKNNEMKRFYIHRLVAKIFIPNPENLPEVNHKDEDKTNNSIDNLEWCDRKYNMNYGARGEKASKKLKGRAGTFTGHKHTDESRKAMSISFKQRDKHPRERKVVCIETGQVFDRIEYAKEWCGGNSHIGQCCTGKFKSAGKHPETGEPLHWMFYDEWIKERVKLD